MQGALDPTRLDFEGPHCRTGEFLKQFSQGMREERNVKGAQAGLN